MKNILRGMALSVMVYCVVTGITLVCVKLCGGEFYQIPGILFLGIGVCTGIFAGVINEKLD